MAPKPNHLKTPATSSAAGHNGAEAVLRRMRQIVQSCGPKSSKGKVRLRERSMKGKESLIRNDLCRREAQARAATLRRMGLDLAEKRAELVWMKEELAEAEAVAEEMAEEVARMTEQKKQATALLRYLMNYGL